MLSPIHFDDKPGSRCIEVHHVLAERFLPIELHSQNLFTAQPSPQMLLDVSEIGSQGPAREFEFWVKAAHGKQSFKSPLPNGGCNFSSLSRPPSSRSRRQVALDQSPSRTASSASSMAR